MYSKVIFLLNITEIEQFDMVLNRLEGCLAPSPVVPFMGLLWPV